MKFYSRVADSNSITFLYVIACNGIIIYSLRASAMNKCNIHDRNRFAIPIQIKLKTALVKYWYVTLLTLVDKYSMKRRDRSHNAA